jgi:hypothetical protein
LKDGVIHMQVSAQHPRIQVYARIQGVAALPKTPPGWQTVLEAEENGYAARVSLKSRP